MGPERRSDLVIEFMTETMLFGGMRWPVFAFIATVVLGVYYYIKDPK